MRTGVTELTIEHGNSVYETRIFLPGSASRRDRVPTILMFHGGGGTGAGQAALDGFEALAEEEGFAVVHPSADPAWPLWEIYDGDHPERDDVAFAEELIDMLIADWCADSARIYSVGFSIGGMQRGYIPDSDKILLASRLLQAGDSQTLLFDAPTEPGVYPYVCTYPGHWRRMYGALYVVPSYKRAFVPA